MTVFINMNVFTEHFKNSRQEMPTRVNEKLGQQLKKNI